MESLLFVILILCVLFIECIDNWSYALEVEAFSLRSDFPWISQLLGLYFDPFNCGFDG